MIASTLGMNEAGGNGLAMSQTQRADNRSTRSHCSAEECKYSKARWLDAGTCSHVLNDSDAEVLIDHGVQASDRISKQHTQLSKGHVDMEVHRVGNAQLSSQPLQLSDGRLITCIPAAPHQLQARCQHCLTCGMPCSFKHQTMDVLYLEHGPWLCML